MEIETSRLRIRNFTGDDASDLYEILSDEETMEFCEPVYSFEKTKAFLNDFCIGRNGAVAAVHKGDCKVIGYILFNELEKGIYEIGWFFNRAYWRQGFAFEACKAVMDYGFANLNARTVFAETIDYIKSVPLMEKLGMEQEELQRGQATDIHGNPADLYVYKLQRESAGESLG